MTELIYDKVNDVIKHSEKNSLSTNSSAIQLAKDRIKENSKKQLHLHLVLEFEAYDKQEILKDKSFTVIIFLF